MDSDHATFAGEGDGFVLRDRHHPLKRAVFGLAGLFAVVMPVWDFWEAFRAPSALSLFFGVIVLGAWAVGGMLLGGALTGDDTELRLDAGRLTLRRKNPLREKSEPLALEDVVKVEVRAHDWESQPETFSVAVRLGSGKTVGSNDYKTRAAVEAIVARIEAALAASRD
jgi:hypothetical protein